MIRCRFCKKSNMEFKGNIHLKYGDKDETLPQYHCKSIGCVARDSAQTYYAWKIRVTLEYSPSRSYQFTTTVVVRGETEQEAIQVLYDEIGKYNFTALLNMDSMVVNSIEKSSLQ